MFSPWLLKRAWQQWQGSRSWVMNEHCALRRLAEGKGRMRQTCAGSPPHAGFPSLLSLCYSLGWYPTPCHWTHSDITCQAGYTSVETTRSLPSLPLVCDAVPQEGKTASPRSEGRHQIIVHWLQEVHLLQQQGNRKGVKRYADKILRGL